MKIRCLCPGNRPVTIATFRHTELAEVHRHHMRPCPLADEPLERVDWQPRPPGPQLVLPEPEPEPEPPPPPKARKRSEKPPATLEARTRRRAPGQSRPASRR